MRDVLITDNLFCGACGYLFSFSYFDGEQEIRRLVTSAEILKVSPVFFHLMMRKIHANGFAMLPFTGDCKAIFEGAENV
jgi:hypothetical protein